jgi:hypothetical protein
LRKRNGEERKRGGEERKRGGFFNLNFQQTITPNFLIFFNSKFILELELKIFVFFLFFVFWFFCFLFLFFPGF